MLTLPRFFALAVGLLAALAGVVLAVAVRTAGHAVVHAGEMLRDATAARVVADVEADLGVAERAIADFEQALASGVVPDRAPEALRRALTAEVIALRSLTDLTLTTGQFLGYETDGAMRVAPEGRWQIWAFRDRDGTLGSRLMEAATAGSADDPTLHDTFRTAAHRDWRDRAIWSDLSYSELDGALAPEARRKTMTVQKAIFDRAGKFVGVLRAGIVSDTLDRIGAERPAGDPHRLFICDRAGRLVTRLGPADRYGVVDEAGHVDPNGDLRVMPAAVPAALAAALQMAKDGGTGGARLLVGGEPILVTLLPVAEGRAQQWLAGIVVPESAYVGPLTAARDRLLVLLLAVVLVIAVVGLAGAAGIGRGMGALVRSTEAMRRFVFDAGAVRSPFREVRAALESVERAKTALRAMVKYVPIGLVRRLYETGREPVLGAELMEISMMFTDIANFTTHAEALPPDGLAEALGRYLDVATRAVEEQGGTVDKYIGDALMVLWNAPTPVTNHPMAACRGALACAQATETLGQTAWWRAAGLPPWHTRFGLHTAPVLVGHFGAPDRLSYTAMGDGVNLAARLEGLNKVYSTTILVTEDIRAAVGDAFVFRQIDRVAVKGRTRAVAVYELLGAAGDAAAEAARPRIAAYESALAAALDRRFADAIARLEVLPGDGAAAVLTARCRAWLATPPPPDWDGTWIATSK